MKVHRVLTRAGVLAAAFAAVAAFSQPASAVTTDTLLFEDKLGDAGDDTQKAALATFLGVNPASLTLTKNNSPSVSFNGSQFILDVAPNEPGYFILKFGIGGPVDKSADHFFFENIAELTLLVFENSQVNNLMKIDDVPTGGTRLSHYSLVNGAPTTLIPLPASLPLFLAALAGLGIVTRRRRAA